MRSGRFAPLAAIALFGCSFIYDPADVEEPPDRAEVSGYVEAWLDAYLAGAAICLATSPQKAATLDLYSRAAYSARLMDLWDRGHLRFDPERAEQCLALTSGAASCDEGSVTRNPGPTHPCASALWGTKGLGEVCGSNLECSTHLYCDGGSGACPGLCAARAGLNAACGSGLPGCQRDLACYSQLSTTYWYCRSRHLPQGAPCTDGLGGCAFGLYCDSVTTHCEYLRGAGEACDGGPCAFGLYCDPTLKCSARAAIGGACIVGDSHCVDGARCDGTGHCQPYAGPGDACGDLADGGESQSCVESRCVGSSCVPYPVRGEATDGPCAPASLGIGNVGGVCSDYCP